MLIIQHNLLVCRVVQGHFHKHSFLFCHNFFGMAQHQNPPCLHILENFVPFCNHELKNLNELQMPLRWVGKIRM